MTVRYSHRKRLLVLHLQLLFLFAIKSTVFSQNSCEVAGVKGQTPASAILVCGSTVFIQDSVPECLNYPIPAPGCRLIGVGDYKDKNPFWFTFTCYSSGSFGFLIEPKDISDNYDWQFYDITGFGASEIYSDGALVRGANWSGTVGITGATSSGLNIRECASSPNDNASPFSKMQDIIEGHTYLLMVSHFDDVSTKGFKLSFKGGSASITNPATPELLNAKVNCDGTEIGLKLTKKMTCSTIAADGSDFVITGLNGLINYALLKTTYMPVTTEGKPKKSLFKRILTVIVIVAILIAGIVFWWNYLYVFGEGVKSGQLNYVVKKGNVFKTYEGKLIQSGFRSQPGSAVQSYEFMFSVVNDSIANVLMNNSGNYFDLHYKEYKGTLPWRGYTRYIVDNIVHMEKPAR